MKSPRRYDVVILGAGVSGLTAARLLADQGRSVCVLEDYPGPGGNHISVDIGPYSFDIGAIFFWNDGPQFQLFPEAGEVCVRTRYSISRIAPDGRVLPYPFSARAELFARSAGYQLRVLADVLRRRLSAAPMRTAADYALRHMGGILFRDSGLANYVRRLCGVSAEEISLAFAQKRMKWVAANATLRGLLGKIRSRAVARGAQRGFDMSMALARPRGGFGLYYAPMVEDLKRRGVVFRFAAGVSSVRRRDGAAEVAHKGGVVRADRVINTFPLNIIAPLAGLPAPLDLRSSRLTTLFCSFAGRRGFESLILYNFHDDGLWKRLTMHSDYYGEADGRAYFSVEATQLDGALTPQALFEDFRRHTAGAGLFDGDLKLEGSLETAFAYPVYHLGADARLEETLATLEAAGIESAGRQGRFDYLPSTTMAVEQVRAAFGPAAE